MTVTINTGVSEVVGTATQISGALTAPVTATQITSITATQVTGSITATQITTASAGAITGTLTASQGGTGRTSVTANYIPFGNGTTALGQIYLSDRLIAYSSGFAITATGDQALTMTATSGSYIVRRVTLAAPVASLSTIIAGMTLRTATEGAGSAVTSTFVWVGLTTSAYLDQIITLASTVANSGALYVNVTAAVSSTTQLVPCAVWGQYLPY